MEQSTVDPCVPMICSILDSPNPILNPVCHLKYRLLVSIWRLSGWRSHRIQPALTKMCRKHPLVPSPWMWMWRWAIPSGSQNCQPYRSVPVPMLCAPPQLQILSRQTPLALASNSRSPCRPANPRKRRVVGSPRPGSVFFNYPPEIRWTHPSARESAQLPIVNRRVHLQTRATFRVSAYFLCLVFSIHSLQLSGGVQSWEKPSVSTTTEGHLFSSPTPAETSADELPASGGPQAGPIPRLPPTTWWSPPSSPEGDVSMEATAEIQRRQSLEQG